MDINWITLPTNFQGERCFTHARAVITPSGFGLMTTQPLRLSGSDVFYEMHMTFTHDGGNTWSALKPSKTLLRQTLENGMEIAMCDATPIYHKKTGKILLLGHYAAYRNDDLSQEPAPRHTVYSVYDEQTEDFTPFRFLEMPQTEDNRYFNAGNGSGQSLELENGDLLIPEYHKVPKTAADTWNGHYDSAVMRCSFDGTRLRLLELGEPLSAAHQAGYCEPSIVKFEDAYLLCLRCFNSAYVTKSKDGLHFAPPKELVFDDGAAAGCYNTQQHWITGGGKLYLVYTRKGADNDHVFRHRAPLFIAEFDPDRMCLIRATEQIAVPNRGARLGNFGCQSLEDGKTAFVFVSEWMQTTLPDPFDWRKCMRYGSDNSIFVSKITF